jgi:O-antigen/teichoic acid export membrane protein
MLVLLISLADLLFTRLVDVAVQAFQAFEKVAHMARLNVVAGTCKLLGAVIVGITLSHPTAVAWGIVYLVSSAIGGVLGVIWVTRLQGMPTLALWRIGPEFAEGCYFSVSLSAQSVYNDIDKTMLTRLGTLDAVGNYAAAYRLIDAAFIPIRSLLYAAYPRFFQHGSTGITGSTRYAKRLLPRSGGYGILACAALMVFAPLVPRFLGKEYVTAVEAVRWLAPIIFFRSIHYFFADSLTGAGYQGRRTAMQASIAALNVALNFWLIPLYSWRGAAWASLVSDGSLMVGLYVVIVLLQRKETKQAVLENAANVAVEA